MKGKGLKLIFFLFLILVFCIVFIPNLFIKWMLLDDGYTIYFVTLLHKFIISFNIQGFIGLFFEATGRLRPIYWIFNYLVWIIFGSNPFGFRLAHVLVWVGIVFLISKIIIKLTKSSIFAFLGSIIFIISPINYENILRIGPQEPLLLLFVLFGVYFLTKNNLYASLVFLVLAIFTKETAIAIMPAVALMYIWYLKINSNKAHRFGKYFFSLVGVSTFIFINYLLNFNKGYVAGYQVTAATIFVNLIKNLQLLFDSHAVLLILTAALVIVNNLSGRKGKKINNYYSWFFLVSFFAFVLIQTPWEYVLARYLTPAVAFLILLFFVELHKTVAGIRVRSRYIVSFVVFFTVAFVSVYTFSRLINLFHSTLRFIYETQLVDKAISFTAENAPRKGYIYVNLAEGLSTQEYIDEIGLHLSLLHKRDDLSVFYLQSKSSIDGIIIDSNIGKKLYETDELLRIFPRKQVQKISTQGYIPIVTTPEGFIKEISKKLFNLAVRHEKLNWDGVYTTYFYKTDWNILI